MADPWDLLAEQMVAEDLAAKTPWVRASATPRFFVCASSEAPTAAPVDYSSPAAEKGTANHKAIEAVENGDVPNLPQLAEDHGADLVELTDAHTNAVSIWDSLAEYFPDGSQAEAKLHGIYTGGTADLFFADGDTMAMVDWKFGAIKRDHRAQVLSYATAAVEEHGMPASGQIDAWVAYPAIDAEPDHWAILPDDLAAFEQRFFEQASKIGKQYAPGDACSFCRRRFECQARADWIRGSALALSEADGTELTAERLGLLYPQAKVLEKALDHYHKALRLALETEGELLTGDGKRLTMSTVAKETIDPGLASAVLSDELTVEDFQSLLSLSKTKLAKVLRDRSPRGTKQQEVDRVMSALEGAGAIRRFRYQKIQPRKA